MNLRRVWLGFSLLSLRLRYSPRRLLSATPVTSVLMTLTVKSGVDRAKMMTVMPEEVRETVKLYLDGKIQQWFSRGDGLGVVFILNCSTVPEAKALMESLPLSKANLVNLEFMPLAPLRPLRLLVNSPAETSSKP